jgi:hypothetical protein
MMKVKISFSFLQMYSPFIGILEKYAIEKMLTNLYRNVNDSKSFSEIDDNTQPFARMGRKA